jgi:hypothetical protein
MKVPLGISTSFIPMLLTISLGGCASQRLAPPPIKTDKAISGLRSDGYMMGIFALNWLIDVGYLETGSAE